MTICGDVLVVPIASDGHLNPIMYVVKRLLERGISVTVLIMEAKQALLEKYVEAGGGLLTVQSIKESKKGEQDGRTHEGHRREGERDEHRREGHGKDGDHPGERRRGGHRREETRQVEGEGKEGQREGHNKHEEHSEGKEGKRPGGGPGVGPLQGGIEFGMDCEPFFKMLLAEQDAGGKGPYCIIADQFQGWTQRWANELNIPRYVAVVSAATYGYFLWSYSFLLKQGLLESGESDPEVKLPGVPLLHLSELSYVAKRNPEIVTDNGDTFGEAAGLLFNTFHDLEKEAIDGFHGQLIVRSSQDRKVPKLLPIGPMLPPEFFTANTYSSTGSDRECVHWLDKQPTASVLYIAFGSLTFLTQDEITELALALEDSDQSFLWVLRVKPSDDEDMETTVSKVLPHGFEAKTKGRGLIYPKFAPQLEILSHPATGGFMTHCGWNSCLESVCRGVPMVAWPRKAEQGLGCRILVDLANVAVAVKSYQDLRVDREMIKTAISRVMTEAKDGALKKRALKFQHLAKEAVAPHGSSQTNFAILVEDIQSKKTGTSKLNVDAII